MRNSGSSPTREAPSLSGVPACSPGHPSPPGRPARGRSGASPRRCPRARPGPGASGGGRARPGLREALSRAPSACQKLRLRLGARPPAPGERPRRALPPATPLRLLRGGGEGRPLRSPRAAAPRVSAGAAGRGGAAGLRPLPPGRYRRCRGGCAPRPAPGPSRAGPAAPRPRVSAAEGSAAEEARAPSLLADSRSLKTCPADVDAQAGCPLSWSGLEPLRPRSSLFSPFLYNAREVTASFGQAAFENSRHGLPRSHRTRHV